MIDYNKLRAELVGYVVGLDEDPSSVSLNRLHKKVAIARTYLDRIRAILLTARKNVRDEERRMTSNAIAYKRSFNTELTKENVKILKTIAQQTAVVELLMQNKIEEKNKLEQDFNEAVDFFNDVKDTYADLRNAAKAVRDQIHVIDQQITIGEIQYKNPVAVRKSNKEKMRINMPSTSQNQIAQKVTESVSTGNLDDGEDL